MTRRSLLTPEKWQEIAALYETGVPSRDLADRFNMTIQNLYWNMLRLGANPPDARALPRRANGPEVMQRGNHVVRRYSEEEDARLLQLEASGATYTEIALALGRRPNSIRGRLLTLARQDAREEIAA